MGCDLKGFHSASTITKKNNNGKFYIYIGNLCTWWLSQWLQFVIQEKRVVTLQVYESDACHMLHDLTISTYVLYTGARSVWFHPTTLLPALVDSHKDSWRPLRIPLAQARWKIHSFNQADVDNITRDVWRHRIYMDIHAMHEKPLGRGQGHDREDKGQGCS